MMTSIARLGATLVGTVAHPRRVRAFSVSLLAAGLLAAGCGTVSAPGAGGVASGGTSGTSGTGGTGGTASATPVPTVTGGPVTPGSPACVGWPADAPRGTLTALWVPVAVERCVTAVQDIPGKGQWETATLERADHGLTALVNALRRPMIQRQPGTMCTDLAMLPPQLVLINSAGQRLIPRLPLTGCGLVQAQLLAALAALPWQPVSVRMIVKIPSWPATPGGSSHSPGTSLQTLPAGG